MQTPEELPRQEIDARLLQSGWLIQDYKKLDFSAGHGIAIREVHLNEGRCDYLLLIDRKPVGIIAAKKAGVTLLSVADRRASKRSVSLIKTSSASIRTSARSPMASMSATTFTASKRVDRMHRATSAMLPSNDDSVVNTSISDRGSSCGPLTF